MPAILRSAAATLFGIVLAALFTKPLETWLASVGWFSGTWVASLLTFLSHIADAPWFPWAAGASFGFWVGVMLDWAARRLDKRVPVLRADRAKALATDVSLLGYEMREAARASTRLSQPSPDQIIRLIGQYRSLTKRLRKLGFSPPEDDGLEAKALGPISVYLAAISEPMKLGDIDVARDMERGFQQE